MSRDGVRVFFGHFVGHHSDPAVITVTLGLGSLVPEHVNPQTQWMLADPDDTFFHLPFGAAIMLCPPSPLKGPVARVALRRPPSNSILGDR